MTLRQDRSGRAGRLVVLAGGTRSGGARDGAVWLVGAGPGDPDLLTIKALKILQIADVLVHDGLVSDEILALAPAAARRISVAKRKSRHSYSQDEINRMLAAFAPLTHRGAAQAVTFVTGHASNGAEPDLDWESLARPNQTVVIYMGLSQATPIAARLMAAGRAGSTPALIVENASRTDEQRIVTTLSGLAEAASALNGPAILIVGEAMALAQAGEA